MLGYIKPTVCSSLLISWPSNRDTVVRAGKKRLNRTLIQWQSAESHIELRMWGILMDQSKSVIFIFSQWIIKTKSVTKISLKWQENVTDIPQRLWELRILMKQWGAESSESGKVIDKNQKWFSRGDLSRSVCHPVGRLRQWWGAWIQVELQSFESRVPTEVRTPNWRL